MIVNICVSQACIRCECNRKYMFVNRYMRYSRGQSREAFKFPIGRSRAAFRLGALSRVLDSPNKLISN